MKKYALAAFIIVAMLLPMTAVADKTIKNEQVAAEDWYIDWINGIGSGDTLKVDATSDKPVDVFILSYNTYWGPYKNNTNFIPTYQILNTTTAKFTWTCPDDQSYCLVFDNRINNLTGSANPSGAATISYTRTDPLEKALEELGTAISTFCLAVVAIVVIIFVVIVVIILLVRKKKKPVEAPPGAAQGAMYGTPTQPQGYQPAPGQYQQQPGQYAPPPPPPAGPGVPPPPGQ